MLILLIFEYHCDKKTEFLCDYIKNLNQEQEQ